MRDLSKTEQKVLDLIEEQIAEIDEELEPYLAKIDEKNRLVRARAALLSEKAPPPGGSGTRQSLSHEQVEHAFQEAESKYLTVAEIAHAVGVNDSTVRSHLHRGKGKTYKQKGDKWRLYGGEAD